MKFFDFHTHVFPDELAERALAKLACGAHIQPFTDGTLSGTAKYLSSEGVDNFLTLHIATNPRQQTNVNNFAISVQNSGVCGAFGSVHPQAPDALDEIQRIHAAGLKGIKLHPEYQEFNLDDKAVYPIYELCRDLNLIVLFHAGVDIAFMNSLRAPIAAFKNIASDIKGLTFIAAHLGGFMLADEVENALAGKADIYLDTSYSAGFVAPHTAEKIIQKHGAANILFGSDCPWGSPAAHIRFIDSLKISAREKEQIFYKNAERLLQN